MIITIIVFTLCFLSIVLSWLCVDMQTERPNAIRNYGKIYKLWVYTWMIVATVLIVYKFFY